MQWTLYQKCCLCYDSESLYPVDSLYRHPAALPDNPRVNFHPGLVTDITSTRAGFRNDECYIVGTHFHLEEDFARMFLGSLPIVVHVRASMDSEAMHWSLRRMREEYLNPQPGSSLIGRQLAHMVFVQALRLHLSQGESWNRMALRAC